jgi:hypothetical protein
MTLARLLKRALRRRGVKGRRPHLTEADRRAILDKWPALAREIGERPTDRAFLRDWLSKSRPNLSDAEREWLVRNYASQLSRARKNLKGVHRCR